jgi:hypothetical protein
MGLPRARVVTGVAILLITTACAGFLLTVTWLTEFFGSGYVALVVVPAVPVCAIVAIWNVQFIHAALVRQRIQAIWLRRFQAEGGEAFRTSRVIDRLARYGISTLTLQDRDVRLSLEQRHQRLAPIFWAFTIPLTAGLSLLSFSLWQAAVHSRVTAGDFASLAEVLGLAEGVIFISVFVAGAMLIAVVAGPIASLLFRGCRARHA